MSGVETVAALGRPTRTGRFPRMSLLVVVLACGLAGCGGGGGDGPEMMQVRGQVTFEGAPIEKGRILFRKQEGDQKAFSGTIENGAYRVETEAGEMRVEIVASRIVPGQFDMSNDEPTPMGEMYIPEKYNSESTLTVTVEAGKRNDFPFDLKAE